MTTNTPHTDELTAAEISGIWTAYQNESMLSCGILHFLQHVDDTDIEQMLTKFLNTSKAHLKTLQDLFTSENYPVPQGFTMHDVNLDAPRLFSDRIYMELMENVTNFNLAAYGLALSQAEHPEIINFYSNAIDENQKLNTQTKELMKQKGFYIRYPKIPKPEQIDFVTKDSFLAGWFGHKRPLLGVEITALVLNAKRNALGEAIIAGFAQVAQAKDARQYLSQGRDIANNHFETFSSILKNDYINDAARILTTEVTNSKTPPYSDKLMTFLITTLIASGLGQYGTSMSLSPRHDLGATYTRLMADIAKYADKGAHLLIEHAWMEQPPTAADRKRLAK